METFPVISSIISAEYLGVFLQDQYHLSANATCKLLKTGINHSYLITDGTDKYVFRLYSLNWRTREEIAEELRLLNLLKQNSIPISYPIADGVNNDILELNTPEGSRYGVMFSFAVGEKLLNFSAEMHYKIGETLARLHAVTLNLELKRANYTPQVILKDSLVKLSEFLPTDSAEMQWMVSAQPYLLNKLENADKGKLRQGVVHLDVWFDNFNITKDGEVTLFDLDFCGNGWLCYDVAYYILQLHSTEKDEAERTLKLNSFLQGYESVTPLTDQERELLPALGVCLYFFYLGIQCERFDNWSNVFLNETYLKRFINLLVKKYFEENVNSSLPVPH